MLDFSRLFAGPLASMTLGDMGAQILKIESPSGDEARHFGPPFLGGEGMNYVALGRGKRSVVLDLKQEQDRARAQQLARRADVIIENFRPGVTGRLGIDYETLSRSNPGLVYCSVTGFDPDGPYRDRAAFDIILQGMSGVMDRQGGEREPEIAVVTIADTFAASLATQGILAALYERTRSGTGQLVQVDLFRAILYAQAYRMVTSAENVQVSAQEDVAPYGAFKAADQWFALAVATDRTFARLCEALGRPDLSTDERFSRNPLRVQNVAALRADLNEVFATESAAHWLDLLDAAGVPAGPIVALEEVFQDPHLVATSAIVELEHPTAGPIWTLGVPLTMSRSPLRVGEAAPSLGQHTEEVLNELSDS